MKVYQEKWLDELNKEDITKEEILNICSKVKNDDTGHTDPLTQRIAYLLIILDYKGIV